MTVDELRAKHGKLYEIYESLKGHEWTLSGEREIYLRPDFEALRSRVWRRIQEVAGMIEAKEREAAKP